MIQGSNGPNLDGVTLQHGDELVVDPGTCWDPNSYSLVLASKTVSVTCSSANLVNDCVLGGSGNSVTAKIGQFINGVWTMSNPNKNILQAYWSSSIMTTSYSGFLFTKGDSTDSSCCGGKGGAIYLSGGAVVTIARCCFTYNSATKGGAIYAASGMIFFYGAYFVDNAASTSFGDDIYEEVAIVVINDGCPASFRGPASQGDPLDTSGSIVGDKFAFSCLNICEAGKYSNQGNTGECTDCPLGRFLPDTENDDPLIHDEESDYNNTCLSGMYATYVNLGAAVHDECMACGAGKYSPGTAGICTDCPAGKYLTDEGSLGAMSRDAHDSVADCLDRDEGKYAPGSRMATCVDCGAGRYSPTKGNNEPSDCLECALGSASDVTVRTNACAWCVSGTYVHRTGLEKCIPCGLGEYSVLPAFMSLIMTGPEECTECVPGRFRGRGSGVDSCEDFAAGYYAGTSKSSICQACLPGTFSEGATSTCTPCGDGEYSEAHASEYSTCPTGSVST